MNRELYREIFQNRHTLLVVVHVENSQQALRNARIAQNEGADGIFLINHITPYTHLLECRAQVQKEMPNFWIGLNCLDMGMKALGIIPNETHGLWVDDGGIEEDGPNPIATAMRFNELRRTSKWPGLHFGGVAFKHQRPVRDLAKVTARAVPFMDVITTSGDGTGIAASVDKIRIMKGSAGCRPLAIASGITPENVSSYMPYADCFLVATGVSFSHTELDPVRVRNLAGILRN